jgi:3-keto-disaccharide hydrolase/BNR repeat protein
MMKRWSGVLASLFLVLGFAGSSFAEGGPATVGSASLINNVPTFTDAGSDARGISPGVFGSEYVRMLELSNGDWLSVYTIYDNNGYTRDPNGGTRLKVSRSSDHGRTWTALATITDPGRDLDNGQMVQLPNGDVLLACRSVRWQESYRLYVYKSTNLGATWSYLSTIDQNNGTPGSLGSPDRGVYEPHLDFLADGRLAAFYANEKHAKETPAYSQIISEKVSSDGGATWGSEIFAAWDTASSAARPGMPVWAKMNNGQYILTFEVCGTDGCNIHYKLSSNGTTWSSGVGTLIPNQLGAPFVVSLADGRLALSSNIHRLSFSNDYGATWYTNDTDPWPDTLWSSVYQTGANEIAVVNSVPRSVGGHDIRLKFLSLASSFSDGFSDGNDLGWTKYGGTWSVSGGAYTVNATSADKAIFTPYVSLVNYSVEADVRLDNAGQASLIFDVTSPSAGADMFVGYGAGIDSGGTVWLGKFNKGFQSLANAPASISTGTAYRLKVLKNNGRIQVYLNGALKIDYTDTSYRRGTIGLRGGFGSSATFDNIAVKPFTYSNDFSAGTNPGWTPYGGTWGFADGVYTVASTSGDKSILSPPVTGTNYTLEADMRLNGAGQGSILWDVQSPTVGADALKGYGVGLDTGGVVWLAKFNNGYTPLINAAATVVSATWYHVKIVITGTRIRVYVDDVLKIDQTDASFNNGALGLRGGFNNNVSFDNVRVY